MWERGNMMPRVMDMISMSAHRRPDGIARGLVPRAAGTVAVGSLLEAGAVVTVRYMESTAATGIVIETETMTVDVVAEAVATAIARGAPTGVEAPARRRTP